jgi:hypothetical protein
VRARLDTVSSPVRRIDASRAKAWPAGAAILFDVLTDGVPGAGGGII